MAEVERNLKIFKYKHSIHKPRIFECRCDVGSCLTAALPWYELCTIYYLQIHRTTCHKVLIYIICLQVWTWLKLDDRHHTDLSPFHLNLLKIQKKKFVFLTGENARGDTICWPRQPSMTLEPRVTPANFLCNFQRVTRLSWKAEIHIAISPSEDGQAQNQQPATQPNNGIASAYQTSMQTLREPGTEIEEHVVRMKRRNRHLCSSWFASAMRTPEKACSTKALLLETPLAKQYCPSLFKVYDGIQPLTHGRRQNELLHTYFRHNTVCKWLHLHKKVYISVLDVYVGK